MTNIYENYRPNEFTIRGEVVEGVELLAQEIMDAGAAESMAEARADAWSVDDFTLARLYRAMPPGIGPASMPVAKSHELPTIASIIHSAARDQAMIEQLRPGNFGKSIEELTSSLFETAEGSTVYGLYSSPFRDLEASEESLVEIRKRAGDQYDDAIEVLLEWLDDE